MLLRVVSRFSSPSPALVLLLSGGATARCGHDGVAWPVNISSLGLALGLCGSMPVCGYMPYVCEGRMADLGGQIRRVVAFFFRVAARWWQAALQMTSRETRIPHNKVRTGGFDLGRSGQPWSRVVLLLLPELWRSEFTRKRRSAGFHKAESLALRCFFFHLPSLLSGMDAEFDGGLICVARRWKARSCGISGDEELSLLCRRGCGKRSKRFGFEVLRGDQSTAASRDPQRRRSYVSVIHGQGGH